MRKIIKKLEFLSEVDWKSIKALIDSKQVTIDHTVMIGGKSVDIHYIVKMLVHISTLNWKAIGEQMDKDQLSFDDKIIVRGKEVNTAHVLRILEYFDKIDWTSFGASIGNSFSFHINLCQVFGNYFSFIFIIKYILRTKLPPLNRSKIPQHRHPRRLQHHPLLRVQNRNHHHLLDANQIVNIAKIMRKMEK